MPLSNCSLCNKTCARSDSLKLHIKRKHPNEFKNIYKEKRSEFTCRYCDKCFARQYTLKVHVKRFHASYFDVLYPKVTYNFQCDHCNKHFNHKRHLKSHLKVHSDQETVRSVNTIAQPPLGIKQKICAMCRTYCTSSTKDMLCHLKNCHDITVELEVLTFSSLSEFLEWKSRVEGEYGVQFRKETTKTSKHHVLTKFTCSHSGIYEPRGQGKRHLKSQGSKKIDAFCPSSINSVINTEGCCTVKHIKTHIGHISQVSDEDSKLQFTCSRSGIYEPRGQGKRHLKLQGSKKIDDLIINTEGCCTAKHVKTHIGHVSQVSDEDSKLQKRQDRLVETINAIVRSTTSVKEIEALERIALSMTPTLAAVRTSNSD